MSSLLPRVACHHRQLAAPGASSEFWETIEPRFLVEAISGGPPRQATWFKTAWDDRELRIFFYAEDDDPRATLTERDAPLYTEEVVEVFLDPIGDLESYFEFEVNPLNAVCDLVLRRTRSGYRKGFGWNCDGLVTEVKKNASGWTAEISIPFESLGPGLSGVGKTWRANFCRIDRPQNVPRELGAWSPTGQALFHVPARFGLLDFVDK